MNLDKAFLLLLASAAVSGFTAPGRRAPRAAFLPKARAARALLADVQEAAEATAEEAAPIASDAMPEAAEAEGTEAAGEAASEEPAEPAPEAPSAETEEVGEAAEGAAAEEPAEPAFDASIYVGNISFDSAESDLRAAFSAHGTVNQVQMPLDRESGRSRGFAFVRMSNAEEHAAAIEAMNRSQLGGRTVYASESVPKDQVAKNKKKYQEKKQSVELGTKIYVGNLDYDTNEGDLKAAFDEFGEVKDCFFPTFEDGSPRGFAFLRMDEEDALQAIESLNGMELDGRILKVAKSLPKGTTKGTKAEKKQAKLYVGNLSWGMEEYELRELFEEYGRVTDCYMPTDRETGQHRGFAFVTMDRGDALRAADECDGYELDGRILRVSEAQPKGSAPAYGGYDGGDAFDGGEDDSWGNEAY